MILSVRVDPALDAAIKRLAANDDRPVSNYIERLLRKHVTEQGIELPDKLQGQRKDGGTL